MKKVGEFNGLPIYEDPNCPPGKMFFMNDNHIEFHQIDARTRWQRLKDWIKGTCKKLFR